MTLADGNATFRGVTMGAQGSLGITWDRLTGLTDLPRSTVDNPRPDRLHDTAVPGWADIGWRQITAEGLQVQGNDNLAALRVAMTDRLSIDELVFADSSIGAGDLMVAVVADRFEYGRGAVEHALGEWRPSAQWLAADPTIFSAVATDHSYGGGGGAGSTDITVTNAGTGQTVSGRGWTTTIVAHGAVTSPFVHLIESGQEVVFRGLTMTDGQTLTITEQRTALVGSARVDGWARTGSEKFLDWPTLPPGDSTFRIGAVTGSVGGVLSTRSAW